MSELPDEFSDNRREFHDLELGIHSEYAIGNGKLDVSYVRNGTTTKASFDKVHIKEVAGEAVLLGMGVIETAEAKELAPHTIIPMEQVIDAEMVLSSDAVVDVHGVAYGDETVDGV